MPKLSYYRKILGSRLGITFFFNLYITVMTEYTKEHGLNGFVTFDSSLSVW